MAKTTRKQRREQTAVKLSQTTKAPAKQVSKKQAGIPGKNKNF